MTGVGDDSSVSSAASPAPSEATTGKEMVSDGKAAKIPD